MSILQASYCGSKIEFCFFTFNKEKELRKFLEIVMNEFGAPTIIFKYKISFFVNPSTYLSQWILKFPIFTTN